MLTHKYMELSQVNKRTITFCVFQPIVGF